MNALTVLLFAAIEILSPKPGAEVPLLPDEQKAVLTKETLAEREAVLSADRHGDKTLARSANWKKSKPVTLKWRSTASETGPWEIVLAEKPDFSDARTFFKGRGKIDPDSGREVHSDGRVREEFVFEVPLANLKIATKYYWKVTSDVTCGRWAHARTCGCKDRKPCVTSEVVTFVTEDLAPRWIAVEGRVGNFRDLGGRKTDDGRRVRQGLVYRGQGLNDNSVEGTVKGRNRLMVEDVEYLTKTLGIKTDLDLRSPMETAGMTESPLGKGVKYVHHSSNAYDGVFGGGKKMMAENFRVFCDERNYPIYFHCIAGADRTGALGYALNAVLGVSPRECATDWESTFYPKLPGGDETAEGKHCWNSEWHFINGFGKYGKPKDSLKRRAELYLLDCGVTPAEIEKFRSIMLK